MAKDQELKNYKVTFVVQAYNAIDALNQAEMYLNTGNRCVDCDVLGPSAARPGERLDPHPADRLPPE